MSRPNMASARPQLTAISAKPLAFSYPNGAPVGTSEKRAGPSQRPAAEFRCGIRRKDAPEEPSSNRHADRHRSFPADVRRIGKPRQPCGHQSRLRRRPAGPSDQRRSRRPDRGNWATPARPPPRWEIDDWPCPVAAAIRTNHCPDRRTTGRRSRPRQRAARCPDPRIDNADKNAAGPKLTGICRQQICRRHRPLGRRIGEQIDRPAPSAPPAAGPV